MRFRQCGEGQGRSVRLTCGLVLALGLIGCGGAAQVESTQLPVKRVVVYRNGVAYFERAGIVDSAQVHFQLREENVGDFLATLAVLERGGQTVRSASFPVELEDEDAVPVDPEFQRALDTWAGKKARKRSLRRVTIDLSEGEHDLRVGYLAETPVWRPSYRLVVGKEGKALLQAWGIVQNQSGEDWEDVEVALVAGAPIAFESTLGDPVIPRRPVVTDQGEVISAVPESQTSYARAEAEPSGAPAPAPRSRMAESRGPGFASSSEAKLGASADVGEDSAFLAEEREAFAAPAPELSIAPREPSRLARVELQTGATRYEVPERVTIPDESATMVLMVSQQVPGESVYLFSPDGGVPDSSQHPFRVARFSNESGGLLERGPIAVFEEGAFLGQGVVESLPAGGQATVPFALMRSVSIRDEVTTDLRGARLYSVERGVLRVERDRATITAYHVKNGEAERARVLIQHRVAQGAKLHEPPAETETLASGQEVLCPVDVPAGAEASLMLEERVAMTTVIDFRTPDARAALRDFIKSGQGTSEQLATLEQILKHAAQLETLDDQETRLAREQRELERSTEETRHSLRAIKDNQQATALRRELTERLAQGTRRLDEITKDLIELRLRRTEQEVRLKEARQGLEIPPPDRRPSRS